MAEVIRTPYIVNAIRRAIGRAFKEGASIVKNNAVSNVTGRVLKRSSGQLASSIYTKVTRTRTGGNLRVGTPLYYGRFWERGFIHYGRAKRNRPRTGKFMPARPWLRPAAEQAIPEISNLINTELERELKATIGSVTIELKLS